MAKLSLGKGTIGRLAVVPQHYSGNISRDRSGQRTNISAILDQIDERAGQRALTLAEIREPKSSLISTLLASECKSQKGRPYEA